jgi:glycosyltransferase involved in cell wall biosynthesis
MASKGAVVNSMKTAVVYLARINDGIWKFVEFANSYRKYDSGYEHDLIVVVKGSCDSFQEEAISRIFVEFSPHFIFIPDNIGVDLHAYRIVARQIPHEKILFLNTHARLASENWLLIYISALASPKVGLVGAFGSYESLYNSWQSIYRAQFEFGNGHISLRNFLRFKWLLKNRNSFVTYCKLILLKIKFFGVSILYTLLRVPSSKFSFIESWFDVSKPGATLGFVNDFPKFPNVHIRSNAFFIRRVDFLKIPMGESLTKLDANLFECGKNSMTNFFLSSGKEVCIVGKNGSSFAVNAWPSSGCFRSGSQSNLLVTDNQTQAFNSMSSSVKEAHKVMTWGDALDGTDGFFTGEHYLAKERLPKQVILKHKKRVKFSVVVPTHSRPELITDLYHGLKNQKYGSWNLKIFDNCSSDSSRISKIAKSDTRVQLVRSKRFLPVTESWNSAISMADGEYVIFLGDDDGLLPNFFKLAEEIINEYNSPDVVYSNLFQFFHPKVHPSHPEGKLQFSESAEFLRGKNASFLLSESERKFYVKNSINLERNFFFQMPCFIMRKEFLDSISTSEGTFLRPFPDYYLANLIMLKAETFVANPTPLTFQGVSLKSFGNTLFNDNTREGFKVLNQQEENFISAKKSEALLPGSSYLNSYILTMLQIQKRDTQSLMTVNFRRYRRIRIFQEIKSLSSFINFRSLWWQISIRRSFWSKLAIFEYLFAIRVLGLLLLSKGSKRLHRAVSSRFSEYFDPHQFRPLVQDLSLKNITSNKTLFNECLKSDFRKSL